MVEVKQEASAKLKEAATGWGRRRGERQGQRYSDEEGGDDGGNADQIRPEALLDGRW